MKTPRHTPANHLRALPVAVLCAVAACAAVSCEDEKHSYVDNVNPQLTPTMVTVDVSTFISDSGYTRYHISTPVWNMFDDTTDPFWTFPMGLELEQYDDRMLPAANVRSDSAIYYSRRRLWRLDGNVVMVNTQRDSFLTQQLFWDQDKRLVYSDSFIHIVKAQHIIEGYGFKSNQQMTEYNVNRPTAIIPVDQAMAKGGSERTAPADSAAAADPYAAGQRPFAPQPASQRQAQERAGAPATPAQGDYLQPKNDGPAYLKPNNTSK